MNLALLHRRFSGETEARFRAAAAKHSFDQVFAHGGTVLEAMAGTATGDPDVAERRMLIDDEVAVVGVLVLADLAAHQRRRGQCRET